MSKVRIGAHRGAMCHAPENSIAAFEKAIEMGTDRIECDIRRSADGHLVMMHDATVERTTDGSGHVHELTLGDLRQLRLADGGRVPTLQESLNCVRGRCEMLLELKAAGIAADVVATVESRDMLSACTLIAFDEEELRAARRAHPAVSIGCFHIEPGAIDPGRLVAELGASLLVVWPRAAEPEIIAAAKEAGLLVRCGFRDDMTYEESFEIFRRMVGMGVDEISCGRPDWIRRMVTGD